MEFDHIIYDLVQAVIKEALTECKQESQISQEWKDFREVYIKVRNMRTIGVSLAFKRGGHLYWS
jgi:hypothetical protein